MWSRPSTNHRDEGGVASSHLALISLRSSFPSVGWGFPDITSTPNVTPRQAGLDLVDAAALALVALTWWQLSEEAVNPGTGEIVLVVGAVGSRSRVLKGRAMSCVDGRLPCNAARAVGGWRPLNPVPPRGTAASTARAASSAPTSFAAILGTRESGPTPCSREWTHAGRGPTWGAGRRVRNTWTAWLTGGLGLRHESGAGQEPPSTRNVGARQHGFLIAESLAVSCC